MELVNGWVLCRRAIRAWTCFRYRDQQYWDACV